MKYSALLFIGLLLLVGVASAADETAPAESSGGWLDGFFSVIDSIIPGGDPAPEPTPAATEVPPFEPVPLSVEIKLKTEFDFTGGDTQTVVFTVTPENVPQIENKTVETTIDFGDGRSANANTPVTHRYESTGNFNLNVSVYNGNETFYKDFPEYILIKAVKQL